MGQTNYTFYCDANCKPDTDPMNRGETRDTTWHQQWVRDGEDPTPCPHCGGPVSRKVSGPKYGCGETIYSDSLGIRPEQIPEAKRRFPDHNFTPDGRMVIKGPAARRQVLKDLGFDRE